MTKMWRQGEEKNDNNSKNTPFTVSLRSLCVCVHIVHLFAPILSNCVSEDMTK